MTTRFSLATIPWSQLDIVAVVICAIATRILKSTYSGHLQETVQLQLYFPIDISQSSMIEIKNICHHSDLEQFQFLVVYSAHFYFEVIALL